MHVQLQPTVFAASLTAALGLAFAVGDARGATRASDFIQNATGACQSALPVFAGQLRNRPLALQNEGTAPAFVSCSFMRPHNSLDGVAAIQIMADNNTAAPIDLTCTLVTGLSKVSSKLLPKTVTLPANQGATSFLWTLVDNGGVPFTDPTINASCQLPVGTGLSMISVIFAFDVGA